VCDLGLTTYQPLWASLFFFQELWHVDSGTLSQICVSISVFPASNDFTMHLGPRVLLAALSRLGRLGAIVDSLSSVTTTGLMEHQLELLCKAAACLPQQHSVSYFMKLWVSGAWGREPRADSRATAVKQCQNIYLSFCRYMWFAIPNWRVIIVCIYEVQ
jgi:hypothetical protein